MVFAAAGLEAVPSHNAQFASAAAAGAFDLQARPVRQYLHSGVTGASYVPL